MGRTCIAHATIHCPINGKKLVSYIRINVDGTVMHTMTMTVRFILMFSPKIIEHLKYVNKCLINKFQILAATTLEASLGALEEGGS